MGSLTCSLHSGRAPSCGNNNKQKQNGATMEVTDDSTLPTLLVMDATIECDTNDRVLRLGEDSVCHLVGFPNKRALDGASLSVLTLYSNTGKKIDCIVYSDQTELRAVTNATQRQLDKFFKTIKCIKHRKKRRAK